MISCTMTNDPYFCKESISPIPLYREHDRPQMVDLMDDMEDEESSPDGRHQDKQVHKEAQISPLDLRSEGWAG